MSAGVGRVEKEDMPRCVKGVNAAPCSTAKLCGVGWCWCGFLMPDKISE